MVDPISTLGIQYSSTQNLTSGASMLTFLTEQLTTGVRSANMKDYTSSEAQKLLNFTAIITEKEGYISMANTLTPRIEVYDSSLSGIEDSALGLSSAISSALSYNSEQNDTLAAQIQGYMDDITYYLNQQVDNRYIFAGSRYEIAPVADIKSLPVPPMENEGITAANTLPSYDAEYTAYDATTMPPPNPNEGRADAYVQDRVAIDAGQTLRYGITSTQEGFQKLVLGMRYAYAATQDPTNYNTYMEQAQNLIADGISDIRAIHTYLANANTTLNQTVEMLGTNVSNLKDSISNIENVDVNEVAVKIQTYQAQLEASYAATSKILQLSLLDYL